VRLDDYFPAGDRVDLIKLDIQGYEQHALQGAERVLRDNSEIKLLFEFWPYGLAQAGIDWRDLVSYLQKREFHLSEISSSRLEDFRANAVEEDPDWYLNLFAAR
ncbi:MAG: FkbM family methyltransferase, partial [Chthoniobacterales bacterium]